MGINVKAIAKFCEACGIKSILQTKPIAKPETCGLKYAPKFVEQIGDTFTCLNKERYLTEYYANQISKLPKPQYSALGKYTDMIGFEELNSILRNPTQNQTKNWRKTIDINNMLYNANEIDKAIFSMKAPCNFDVYRGVSHLTKAEAQALQGQIISDLGYGSTSLSSKVAESFGDVVFKINIPKNSNVALIDSMSMFKGVEKEVLLPRGYKLKVNEVKTYINMGKEQTLVQAELLQTPTSPSLDRYYKLFDKSKFIETKFLDDFEKMTSTLSKEEMDFLSKVNPGAYNRHLRSLGHSRAQAHSEHILARSNQFDKVLKKFKTSSDTTLYIDSKQFNVKEPQIGQILIDKGFTLGNFNTIKMANSDFIYRLNLPSGSNCYFSNTISGKANESLILPRNTGYEVLGISEIKVNDKIMKMFDIKMTNV